MSSRPRTSAGGERRWFWVCFLALALGFAGLATLTYLGLPSFLAPRLSPELTELREGRLRDWHEVYGRTSVYEKGTHLIRYQFHVDPFPETFSLQGSGLAGDAQALKLAPGTPVSFRIAPAAPQSGSGLYVVEFRSGGGVLLRLSRSISDDKYGRVGFVVIFVVFWGLWGLFAWAFGQVCWAARKRL